MGASIEILDLRHFAAPVLRPVLEAEGELWEQRLHWDYHASARLLMQYLDNHMLPGYAALEAGQVTGYVFCVYEETKAVIGDVFALPATPDGANGGSGLGPRHGRDAAEASFRAAAQLAARRSHRVATAVASRPGAHSAAFREAGFEHLPPAFHGAAAGRTWNPSQANLPGNLEMRPWREEDLAPASRLICEAYRSHPDSLINDQYRSVHGSMRFLQQHRALRRLRRLFPAGVARGGGARQPRAGRAGAGLARQRAKRPHHPGLRSPGVPAPRAGPPAARAWPHSASCGWASARFRSP